MPAEDEPMTAVVASSSVTWEPGGGGLCREMNRGTPGVEKGKLRHRKGIWREAGLPQCSGGLSVG